MEGWNRLLALLILCREEPASLLEEEQDKGWEGRGLYYVEIPNNRLRINDDVDIGCH